MNEIKLFVEVCLFNNEKNNKHKSDDFIVPLANVNTSIGSSRQNQIFLPSSQVSRYHAQIAYHNSDKSYWLQDLNSTNGTYLNREKISPNQEIPLAVNDKITIHPYTLTIKKFSERSNPKIKTAIVDTNSSDDLSRQLIKQFLNNKADPKTDAKLEIYVGKKKIKNFSLGNLPTRLTIGRDESCNIQLTHKSVSRQHGIIEKDHHDILWLSDCASSNGIIHNGKAIEKRIQLINDSEFEIGIYRMRLKDQFAVKFDDSEMTKPSENEIKNSNNLQQNFTLSHFGAIFFYSSTVIIIGLSVFVIIWILFQ